MHVKRAPLGEHASTGRSGDGYAMSPAGPAHQGRETSHSGMWSGPCKRRPHPPGPGVLHVSLPRGRAPGSTRGIALIMRSLCRFPYHGVRARSTRASASSSTMAASAAYHRVSGHDNELGDCGSSRTPEKPSGAKKLASNSALFVVGALLGALVRGAWKHEPAAVDVASSPIPASVLSPRIQTIMTPNDRYVLTKIGLLRYAVGAPVGPSA